MKIKCFIGFIIMTLCCGNILAQNEISEPTQEPMAPYRLFRTTNMWTFIELDTMTGLMWQIQFDVQGNNRGSFVLNDKSLLDGGKSISGRFTLYPTANMYTFILLDQINGRTWQVQWSSDEKNRFVLPISK